MSVQKRTDTVVNEETQYVITCENCDSRFILFDYIKYSHHLNHLYVKIEKIDEKGLYCPYCGKPTKKGE
jgi:DNA-directed RNA polymerase subunit RPC12/RpoP